MTNPQAVSRIGQRIDRRCETRVGERGSVTAETAVVLPALVLVMVVLLGVAHLIGSQLAVEDAARVGARAAARGESDGVVTRLADSVAPAGSDVTVVRTGGLVTVSVRAVVRPLGPTVRFVPSITVAAQAVAADESVQSLATPREGSGSP